MLILVRLSRVAQGNRAILSRNLPAQQGRQLEVQGDKRSQLRFRARQYKQILIELIVSQAAESYTHFVTKIES